jgi:hypothetical protein
MYELLHEIPADIEFLNQHETDKTNRCAHIDGFLSQETSMLPI